MQLRYIVDIFAKFFQNYCYTLNSSYNVYCKFNIVKDYSCSKLKIQL